MLTETGEITRHQDWTLRVRPPVDDTPGPVLLMIHGWTGDENSLWIFTPRLPKSYYLLALRGRYPADTGGYGWVKEHGESLSSTFDFGPAVAAVKSLLQELQAEQSSSSSPFRLADFSRLSLMGFSQGAALSYCLLLDDPPRYQRLAALAGFLPPESDSALTPGKLTGKPIFIGHGTVDETVPVDLARQAVEKLESAGADVTYCEDAVGHKLSANCFRGLAEFFKSSD